MKKNLALLACALCLTTFSIAQKTSDYDKAAAEIKADIWGAKDPDFESNEVPEQYKNESAIVLAKKYDVSAKTKNHFRFMAGMGSKEIIFRYTLRQKVLIQDKSALEDFSEISYSKINKSTVGSFLIKQTDEINNFIGARVYKKNGGVKEMLLDEAVLLKDEKNKKEAKLAISDLEVGDILDYYILSLEKKELTTIEPMQFLLAGEYPILKFRLEGEISKKYGVEFQSLNGAPIIETSKDVDGDVLLALKASNLDKFSTTQWINPMRQAKMVRLKISLCGPYYGDCKGGEITGIVTEEYIYNEQKAYLQKLVDAYGHGEIASRNIKAVDQAVNALKRRLGKVPPSDSLLSTIYNTLRFEFYYSISSNNKIIAGKQQNQASISSNYFAAYLSFLLKDNNLDNQLIFFSSRYMPKIKDVATYDQPIFMVHVLGSKDYYLTDDGIFTQMGLVPGYAEGENGVTLEYKSFHTLFNKSKGIDRGITTIPISKAADNKTLESLQVVISLEGQPSATVEKQSTSTGLMKEAGQKNLMLFEDYNHDARIDQGEKQTFVEEFADNKKTKSLADEWQNAFTKARETYKDAFMQDLRGEYNIEPKELISYKIDKSGVTLNKPAFQYTTKFVMQDWVKKAGNNYLFEIGKAIGSQLRIKEEDRIRTFDVYEPYARCFEYQIKVTIPAGYNIEGADALNKNIENECGSFTCKATVLGDQLLVAVKKEYTHNFEPAANWSKMLAFIDAAADFSNAKVLLKKK